MKADWVSAIDHDAVAMTICAGPELFALQYAADGTWRWTCDAGGFVIPFTDDMIAGAGELPPETRRIPWREVPARLKRIADSGNRKARRALLSARRRAAWTAHKYGRG